MYELVANHQEEITWLMEEYDAHEIDVVARLDGYEHECQLENGEVEPKNKKSPSNDFEQMNEEEGD